MTLLAEQLTGRVTFHGEGAVWSELWVGLRCVDMLAGEVLDVDADGRVTRHKVGSVAAMIRPCSEGLSVVALERSVALWDEQAGTVEPLATPLLGEGRRFNEGVCTPDGALLIGSLAYDLHPGGGELLRIEPSGETSVVLSDVTISNGVGFAPDGTRAYYVDSARGAIEVFTLTDSGRWVDRRTLVAIDPEQGTPDGLWVDTEGGVWVALHGGGAIHRYLPDGRLDEIVTVPARQVTSCTFGGPRLQTLFITTSRENLADDDDPLAGSLFCVETGIRGLAALPFGWSGVVSAP